MAGRKSTPAIRQFDPGKFEALRKAKSITRRKLSADVGVTEMTIYNWGIGQSVPDTNQSLRLAASLGVNHDELLT
jgi:DNA-binding transcriptional regulator YiaG